MCRWCGLLIRNEDGTLNRKKTYCGEECRTHYRLRADPQVMRQHVFFRDQGKCSACGAVHRYLDGDWEADHIRPLMMAFGCDASFWEPENLTLLCRTPCHRDKSKRDLLEFQRKFRRNVSKILSEIEED